MTRKCIGDKCKVLRKHCNVVKTIFVRTHSKCSFKKFISKNKHHGKRKECCRWMSRCTKSLNKAKSCKVLNRKCKFTSVITWYKRKSCKWMTIKEGRNKRCCSYLNYCTEGKCVKKK